MTVAGSAPAGAAGGPRKIRVIFVCTTNAAGSQMAEAILRHDAGDRFDVSSGGIDLQPVHPMTLAALAKVGIDASDATSKSVTRFLGQRFDYIITVCDRARTSCPVFPAGAETLHWGFDDPMEATGTDAERQAVFDRVMTQLAGRIRQFVLLAEAAHSAA